ncbi:MAG: SDR family oxidoreductase [Alphaproteobacteria bacterium]|nr:SDR family oxidoreductase [Alphaproteobacteria bacterium]
MGQRLADAVAVVTGAGSGIGRAIALAFLREGALVLGIDRNAVGLGETGACASSDRYSSLVGDVADPRLPDTLQRALAARGGRLDILVNNAGIGGNADAEETTDADLQRFLDVNVLGLFRLSRFAVGIMRGQKSGVILNTASVFALMGATRSPAYSASKGAVTALTRQMATDYGPFGIRVNALAPGLIDTPLTAERIRTEAWRRRICIEQTPLGRAGTPGDVAGAALFLCSNEAAFITGQVLVIDGGWDMCGFPREPGT